MNIVWVIVAINIVTGQTLHHESEYDSLGQCRTAVLETHIHHFSSQWSLWCQPVKVEEGEAI